MVVVERGRRRGRRRRLILNEEGKRSVVIEGRCGGEEAGEGGELGGGRGRGGSGRGGGRWEEG